MASSPDSPVGMVDWDLAVRIGSRLAGDGPEIGRDEADDVVAELRDDANRSTGLVRDFTGLVAADTRRRCWWWTGPGGCRPTPTASRS